jgi:dihydroflavonol-4-reductase
VAHQHFRDRFDPLRHRWERNCPGIAQAAKVPTRTIPDVVVRLGGLFNAEMAQLAPKLGQRANISAAKAERVLGWRTRAASASIIDAAMSLIARGLV